MFQVREVLCEKLFARRSSMEHGSEELTFTNTTVPLHYLHLQSFDLPIYPAATCKGFSNNECRH
jgi:hypothetical protein